MNATPEKKIPHFYAITIGVEILFLISVAIAAVILAYAINTTAGGRSLIGPGAIILLVLFLLAVATVITSAWWLLRRLLKKTSPQKTGTQPTAGATTPSSATTTTSKKESKSRRGIKTILVWGVILGTLFWFGTRVIRPHGVSDGSTIGSLWPSPPPQPEGRCDDSFAQDDLGIYNFSQSPNDRVRIEPGSATKLCYGSLVSIPGDRWKTWGAQFIPPAGQKERCVAYLSYIYPDHSVRVIGPLYGPHLELSDMSGLWRIATNCPVEYYRW